MYRGKVEGRVLNLLGFCHIDSAEFCCQDMTFFLNEGKVPVAYLAAFKEYAIKFPESNTLQLMKFCPWCGTAFPPSLRNKCFDIIFDELELDGLDDPHLPPEFKTDEWWKKRGL